MKNEKIISAVSKDPLAVLLLGAFPAMASTASLKGALAMGLAITVIMIISAAIISLLKKQITDNLFLPVCTALSCFLAVAAAMLINAWFPGAYEQTGLYISVAAVSLLLYGNSVFAYEKKPGKAVKNALFTGLFFLCVLLAVALIREVFGSAKIFGAEIGFMKSFTCAVLAQPAGGFLIYAIIAAVVSRIVTGKSSVDEVKEEAA